MGLGVYNLIFLFPLIVPFFLTQLIYKLERKWNEKIVIFIDIFCFFFFTIYGSIPFVINSLAISGLSSNGTINYIVIVHLRNFIGFVWGYIYSLFVNFKQLNRYFRIEEEQKRNLFTVLILLELFLIYFFIQLCHYF